MKIAVVTQKLDPNDYVFGFFYGHIIDLAAVCERVEVVCLECAPRVHMLPKNVRVHSLGKESDVEKLTYAWRFLTFLWRERKAFDTLLVHMEPIYVLLGYIPLALFRKKIVLWYNHVYCDWKLWLARYGVDTILTASPHGVPVTHPEIVVVSYEQDLTYYLTKR